MPLLVSLLLLAPWHDQGLRHLLGWYIFKRIWILVFGSIKSTLWKVIYIIVMWWFGFGLVQCILCIFGIIHIFDKPCQVTIFALTAQSFQSAGSWHDAYHAIVAEKSCDVAGKIQKSLNDIFNRWMKWKSW
jgi:hypothetical protein